MFRAKGSALPPEFDCRPWQSHLAGTNMPIPDNGGTPLKPHKKLLGSKLKNCFTRHQPELSPPVPSLKKALRATPFSHSCCDYYTMFGASCQENFSNSHNVACFPRKNFQNPQKILTYPYFCDRITT